MNTRKKKATAATFEVAATKPNGRPYSMAMFARVTMPKGIIMDRDDSGTPQGFQVTINRRYVTITRAMLNNAMANSRGVHAIKLVEVNGKPCIELISSHCPSTLDGRVKRGRAYVESLLDSMALIGLDLDKLVLAPTSA